MTQKKAADEIHGFVYSKIRFDTKNSRGGIGFSTTGFWYLFRLCDC
jgi:hypothetical protein